ncbi:hypothetical protein HK104_004747 [Borealophlyctis nickersoniae]|nr:hypothetical protein HK104_004747 [Borealophlyctis nickersoniae]
MLGEDHSWAVMGWIQVCTGSLILGYDSGIVSSTEVGTGLNLFVLVPGWFVFIIGGVYVLLGVFGGAKLKESRRRDPPTDHDADTVMKPHFPSVPAPPRSTYKDVETASTHSTMRMGGRRDSYYTTSSVYSPDAVIAHY